MVLESADISVDCSMRDDAVRLDYLDVTSVCGRSRVSVAEIKSSDPNNSLADTPSWVGGETTRGLSENERRGGCGAVASRSAGGVAGWRRAKNRECGGVVGWLVSDVRGRG